MRRPPGEPLDCTSGPPRQCTATCARSFVPFWNDCKDNQHNHLGGTRTGEDFDSFDIECTATHYNDEGNGVVGKNVLDPDSVCAINKQ